MIYPITCCNINDKAFFKEVLGVFQISIAINELIGLIVVLDRDASEISLNGVPKSNSFRGQVCRYNVIFQNVLHIDHTGFCEPPVRFKNFGRIPRSDVSLQAEIFEGGDKSFIRWCEQGDIIGKIELFSQFGYVESFD